MKVVKGDLLRLAEQGHFDIIVHGCNCFNTMGSGIAKQVKAEYPEAYAADCKTVKGDINKLGTYTYELVLPYCGEPFVIINAYTQFRYNYAGDRADLFEYAAFELILKKLAYNYYPGVRFGFPEIGMGRAGGDKYTIIDMLEQFSDEIESTGGTVTLVKFQP